MPDFEDTEDEPARTSEFWHAAAWGFSALLIGCTLLLAACTLMVFNVILFHGGFAGIPVELARAAGLIGVLGVALLGIFSVGFGFRGWVMSRDDRGPSGLGIAGTAMSAVGLVAWLIAGGDLLAILGVF